MRNIIVFLIASTSLSMARGQQLADVRLLYRDATKSKAQAEAFYEAVKAVEQTDNPVRVAYKGAGLTLMARYEKLANRGPKVKEAIQWIEQAAASDPSNAEIRLIRLSVQEHLPRFLKYNEQIDEDRTFVQEARPALKDESLKAMIDGYFDTYSKK